MKFRAMGIAAAALLLCGCSDADWDNLLSFGPSNNAQVASDQAAPDMAAPPPTETTAPTPAAEVATVAPQPSYTVTQTTTTVTSVMPDNTTRYCRQMAQNSGAVATRDGMDGPAQQQAADATYRECEAFYGASGQ
jgi:PBP1b-binding outer membrane lipoprotein LpoB